MIATPSTPSTGPDGLTLDEDALAPASVPRPTFRERLLLGALNTRALLVAMGDFFARRGSGATPLARVGLALLSLACLAVFAVNILLTAERLSQALSSREVGGAANAIRFLFLAGTLLASLLPGGLGLLGLTSNLLRLFGIKDTPEKAGAAIARQNATIRERFALSERAELDSCSHAGTDLARRPTPRL